MRLLGVDGAHRYRLHQWANDWISATSGDGAARILAPTSVELDDGEAEQIRSHPRPDHAGLFWQLWELYEHVPGRWRFRRRGREATV